MNFILRLNLIGLLMLFTMPSAVSMEHLIPKDSITGEYIQFGSGGGYTGASTHYILTKDGRLFSYSETLNSRTPNVFLKKISSCKRKRIVTYIHKNGLTDVDYNEPGNTYSYITLFEKGTHTFTWGNPDNAPSKVIYLNQLLRSLL